LRKSKKARLPSRNAKLAKQDHPVGPTNFFKTGCNGFCRADTARSCKAKSGDRTCHAVAFMRCGKSEQPSHNSDVWVRTSLDCHCDVSKFQNSRTSEPCCNARAAKPGQRLAR
jgi:hypothetical protein